jgi:hypothetical protein
MISAVHTGCTYYCFRPKTPNIVCKAGALGEDLSSKKRGFAPSTPERADFHGKIGCTVAGDERKELVSPTAANQKCKKQGVPQQHKRKDARRLTPLPISMHVSTIGGSFNNDRETRLGTHGKKFSPTKTVLKEVANARALFVKACT